MGQKQRIFKVLSFFILSVSVVCNAQEAPDGCPDISSCDIVCQFGFRTDSNECELCECNDGPTDPTDPPSPTCPPLSCDLDCPHGLEMVEGCNICECKPCPPAVRCAIICENGFKLDENGCTTCECETVEEKCETLNCDEMCPFGHDIGPDGCMTCECIENPCQCKESETCIINEKLEWDCEEVPGENEECDVGDEDDREMSKSKSKSHSCNTGTKHTGTKHTGTKGTKHTGTKHTGTKGTKHTGTKGTKHTGTKHSRTNHTSNYHEHSGTNHTHEHTGTKHRHSGTKKSGTKHSGTKHTGTKKTGTKHTGTKCPYGTHNHTHSESHSGSDSKSGSKKRSVPERLLQQSSSDSEREEEKEEQDRIREANDGAASRNFFRNLKTKSDSCKDGYYCRKSSDKSSTGVCSAIPTNGPCYNSSSNPDEECDKNGYYKLKMCTENSDGDTECVCVNSQNGAKLEKTRKVLKSKKEIKKFNCIDEVYGTCSVTYKDRTYLVKHGKEHFDRSNCRRCRCYSGGLYCDESLTVCNATGTNSSLTAGRKSCILDDGTTVEHGTSYTDDCNRCFCRNGKSICSRFSCSGVSRVECPQCSSEMVDKVCGPNGKTYLNLCTAVNCAGFEEDEVLNGTCTSNHPCDLFPCENGEICFRQGGVSCLAQGGCIPDEVRVCLNIRSLQCDFSSITTPTSPPDDGAGTTGDGAIGSGDVDSTDTTICGSDGRSYSAICHIIPNYVRVQVAHAGRCDDENCRGGTVCGTDAETYENICALKTFSANARLDYPGECVDSDGITYEEYCQSVVDEGLCQYSSENCDHLVQPVVGCCPICGSSFVFILDKEELEVAATIVSSMSTLDNLVGNFITSDIFSDLTERCKLEATLTSDGNIEFVLSPVEDDDMDFCLMQTDSVIRLINSNPTSSTTTTGRKRQSSDADDNQQLPSSFQVVLGAAVAPDAAESSESGVARVSMAFAMIGFLVSATLFITQVL